MFARDNIMYELPHRDQNDCTFYFRWNFSRHISEKSGVPQALL